VSHFGDLLGEYILIVCHSLPESTSVTACGRLDFKACILFACDVVHIKFTGMVYLHQQDIIHRDLKSSNGEKLHLCY